jgi:5-methylcytosine-specific restriction enzyme subunit McrC
LSLAHLILEETEVNVESVGSAFDLSAVVVDFDTLFEEYVRDALRLERQRLGIGLVVLDGNKEGKKYLFDNRSDPFAKPDIVIRSAGGETRLLLEVKYKSFPDRSDYNQAITYATSYKVDTIVLVHQATKAAHVGLAEIGRVGPVRLLRFGLSLDHPPLIEEEQRLASSIFSLSEQKQLSNAA